MSYTTEVDIRELVDGLSLTGKKLLVSYLKEAMGDYFAVEPNDEEKNRLGLLDVDVSVDSDDVIDNLSSWERRDLYDDLHEEFGEDPEEDESFSGGTYSEQEFGKVLMKLWEDRWLLTPQQKARIEAITKESFV